MVLVCPLKLNEQSFYFIARFCCDGLLMAADELDGKDVATCVFGLLRSQFGMQAMDDKGPAPAGRRFARQPVECSGPHALQQDNQRSMDECKPAPAFAHIVQERRRQQRRMGLAGLFQRMQHCQAMALVASRHLPEQRLRRRPQPSIGFLQIPCAHPRQRRAKKLTRTINSLPYQLPTSNRKSNTAGPPINKPIKSNPLRRGNKMSAMKM